MHKGEKKEEYGEGIAKLDMANFKLLVGSRGERNPNIYTSAFVGAATVLLISMPS